MGEFGQVGKETIFEEHRDGWVKVGKVGRVGKSEDSKTDEQREDQDE